MMKPDCTTKDKESSIVSNAKTYYEPKNTEGPMEGQPDGQENESKEEESREGRFIMR